MSISVTVKGNVGTDPEIKFVKDNLALTTFSLAYTPRIQKNKEWVDGETMWFRIVQFGDKAEQLVDNVKKGDTVMVQGSMRQNTFTGKDGTEKTSLEINATDIGIVPRAKKKQEAPSW
jgi:single-strand DNA-binding protein